MNSLSLLANFRPGKKQKDKGQERTEQKKERTNQKTGTCGSERYPAFSNDSKMVTILNREQERKVEKAYAFGHAAKDPKQYKLPAWVNHN